jgi:transcription elongation factor
MRKFEILSVIRNTLENEMGDTRAIFTVKYKVRINKKITIDGEEVLFASDELDAYNRAKQIISRKEF